MTGNQKKTFFLKKRFSYKKVQKLFLKKVQKWPFLAKKKCWHTGFERISIFLQKKNFF